MSVQTEINRIQTARNTLRTKAVSLGVGLATDNLTQLATKYDGITDRGTPNAEVQEGQSYTIEPGYYHGGVVTGVAGGGNYNLQAKSVTPTKSEQTIGSDSGYYGLSSVTVGAIPDTYQDVSSVTATAADVLSPSVFVKANGDITAGTMPNRGAVSKTLDTSTISYTIPSGYHNGNGEVSITTETKTATPSESTQTISPSNGKVLSSVTIDPIPVNYGDTTGTNATSPDLLSGKKALVAITEPGPYGPTVTGTKLVTGTMPNNGAVSKTLDTSTTSYYIPAGYHNGQGNVRITTETKTATPSESTQTISPASGKVLSSVTVNPIPSKYGDASGATVTAGHILSGDTAIGYDSATGEAVVVTGTMPDNTGWEFNVASSIMPRKGGVVPIPNGYHFASTISIPSLEDLTPVDTDKTAVTASRMLTGYQAWVEGVKVSGTMPNNGAVSPTALSAGGSYTIPAGYHNGSGTVTAKSLSSQTGVDSGKTAVTAANMLTGYQGWVNGTKVSGTMPNNGSTGGTITGLGSVAGDTSYTIPAGYTSGGTVSLTSDIETALAAI